MDDRIAHIEPGRMWTGAALVHEVIHKGSPDESRYTALKADLTGVFHVSTGIHSKLRQIDLMVMNTHPQCGKDDDGCG